MFYPQMVIIMLMHYNIIFSIKDIKLYVPLVILSVKGNEKLAKHFTKGYKVQSIE